ncbi:hypothetical protein LCGC14_1894840 [marine sediment metagenome]|uniref:Uncharacterized protein n=1 Tax=marine sediment metagenome TaxID=412755 RepID=A0A0F9FYN0_9ZZZZ
MGTFEATSARQRLGFIPTTATRANIDVRTGAGAVGQAIGRAALTGASIIQEIHRKRQQMQDANSDVVASKLRQTADAEFRTFKLTNPQETWEPFRMQQTERVGAEIGKLQFSPNALALQQSKSQLYSSVENAQALTDATRQLRTDTIDAQTEALTDDFRSGDPVRIAEGARRFANNGDNMGKDKAEVLSDIQAARQAGAKLRTSDLVNSVNAAIETKDFILARSIAQDPAIPETTQTSLRNSITNAERQVLKQAQEQTGVDIVLKYWDNKLTDNDLDSAAAAGLISADNLDKWKKRVREPSALTTDPAANAQAMQANIDVSRGVLTFAEASQQIQDLAGKLNATDGKARIADLQKGFAAAQSEKVNEWITNGRAIVSPRFRGPGGLEALLAQFDFDDKERTNEQRRFDAETRLRENYEIALNQWFAAESRRRKEPISLRDIEDFSLRLRNSYQSLSRNQDVEALERTVQQQTTKQLARPRVTAQPLPVEQPSDVSAIPTAESAKQAEIRQLTEELKRRGQ